MRRYEDRIVDLESEAGPLRVALWMDGWVVAWRREDSEGAQEPFDVFARSAEELFDVFARVVDDLVQPLIHVGMDERAARLLAEKLIAERAVMDSEDQQERADRMPLRTKAGRFLRRKR